MNLKLFILFFNLNNIPYTYYKKISMWYMVPTTNLYLSCLQIQNYTKCYSNTILNYIELNCFLKIILTKYLNLTMHLLVPTSPHTNALNSDLPILYTFIHINDNL